MSMTLRMTSAILLLSLFSAEHAALPQEVNGEPLPSLAPLVKRVAPAVVNIRVSQTLESQSPYGDEMFRRFFGIPDAPRGRSREVASAGSGVIVDAKNGYILTNHHVVENADQIQISLLNEETLDAEVIGSDALTDIALLQVDPDGLTDLPIGESDNVEVGDFVLAIGNPFGLGHTVTSGIVSALGRTGISRNGIEDFIQTDASINPGNSGGALVNMRGELVGINSAIISRTGGNVGIGFAVPSKIASSIMRQILDFGEVRRGLLGVTIQTIDKESAKALGTQVDHGALITGIEPGSAAEEAGLRVDDIITGIDEAKGWHDNTDQVIGPGTRYHEPRVSTGHDDILDLGQSHPTVDDHHLGSGDHHRSHRAAAQVECAGQQVVFEPLDETLGPGGYEHCREFSRTERMFQRVDRAMT